MKFKNVSEIIGRMTDLVLINQTSNGLNDFTEGSVLQTLLESISLELYQYYLLQKSNIYEATPQGIFEAFDFKRREARKSYGEVTINFNTANSRAVHVPRGTRFMSRKRGYDQTFETLEDYYVNPGVVSSKVKVYCTEIGSYGNVPAGAIDTAGVNLMNLASVTNEDDFLTGQDQEPLEDVKRRFRMFVDTRGRATNKAIEYATRSVPDITGAFVDESTGWVKVYAHDNAGNLSEELRKQVEDLVEDYRPSGIRLTIHPINRVNLNVKVNVFVRGADNAVDGTLRSDLTYLTRQYINRHETGESLVLQDLAQQIMNYDDDIIYDVDFAEPLGNLDIEVNQLVRAKDVDVNLILFNEEVLRDKIRFDV